MTGHADPHAMRPEFRAHLEWQIASALRRENRFAAPAARRASKLGAALVLLVAVAMGAGAVKASDQLQEKQQREALLEAMKAEQELARLRLQLARSALQDEQKRLDVGAVSREALAVAETQVKAMETLIKKLALDMEEIQATAKSPRDDLQAPLVGNRDFVADRLGVELQSAQAALVAAEQATANTKRRFDVGLATRVALLQAETAVSGARDRLVELQQTLELRRRAVGGEIKAEEIAPALRSVELRSQLLQAERQLALAQARIEEVRKQNSVGQATELDVKRAEIELLERRLELQRLQQEFSKLGAVKR